MSRAITVEPKVLLACPVYKKRKLLGTWRLRLIEVYHTQLLDSERYELLIYKSTSDLTPHQVLLIDSVRANQHFRCFLSR